MRKEVVVVGAGPAGSTAAKNLAENGIDVLLIDKATFPRDKPCGGGIPMKVLKRFSYLKNSDLIESFSYGGAVYSSSLRYKIEIEKEKPIIAMVHRDKFDAGLVDIAIEKGADFIGGKAVKNIKISSDKAKITVNDGSTIDAEIVIGADGFKSIIRKKSELNPKKEYFAVCIFEEYPMSSKTVTKWFTEKRSVHIFLKILGMRGYGWSFPKKDSVNIGVGEYQFLGRSNEDKKNLTDLYKSFLSLLKNQKIIPKDLKIKKLQGGGFLIWPLKKTYADRVLLCGDAAGFVNPTTGEGIYNAMTSGEIASGVIINSLEKEDTSKNFLSKYQKIWKNDFGRDLKLLSRSTNRWGIENETFIKRISQDNKLAEMCLDVMTGEKSIYQMRWKIARRYISAVLKEKIKRK